MRGGITQYYKDSSSEPCRSAEQPAGALLTEILVSPLRAGCARGGHYERGKEGGEIRRSRRMAKFSKINDGVR